ncbi:MAG: hypothetical protein B6244_01400 [Candidatus Cloacimonetes bacterium 4572_55]|nr:MAG: hypothetical protein B6244_01400 [Candidatus Cloacimonetes bacterium 4572_55]
MVDENNEVVYRNIFRREDMKNFQKLYTIVNNWKSCQIYVNGYKINFDVDDGLGFNCYMGFLNHGGPSSNYCQHMGQWARSIGPLPNYFGCFRSHISFIQWKRKPWFHFISENKNNRIKINLDDMLEVARNNLEKCRLCPLIDLKKVESMIRAMPPYVDLKRSSYWAQWYQNSLYPGDQRRYQKDMLSRISKFL